MQYTIFPSDDQKYIIIKTTGDVTRANALQVNIEAHALGARLGIQRYLADMTETRNVDSPADDYEFANADMQTAPQINRYARVAVLISPDDHSHDFLETVAINAGMNLRLFTDREAAIRFLTTDRLR